MAQNRKRPQPERELRRFLGPWDEMIMSQCNTPDQEPAVKTVEREIKSLKSEKVPPFSANIYVFKMK